MIDKRLTHVLARAIRPLPKITVSEWAEQYRRLPSEEAEGGPYRISRVPFLREIMDNLSPQSGIQQIAVIKSAQIGVTEAGNNWIGYLVHHSPGRILQVQPTELAAKRHSRTRIAPLFNRTPVLRDLVAPTRSHNSGNTMLQKEFLGGVLILAGANSPIGLRSVPAQNMMLDDIDGYPYDLYGEGDPIEIVGQRSRTYGVKRKIFYLSTPTNQETSRIFRLYEESDKRRYYVPCPWCESMQFMEWKQVRWPDGAPEEARYHCIDCHEAWDDWQRINATMKGEWRAERELGEEMIAGYRLNNLYSHWSTPAQMATKFLRVKDDPVQFKSFVNLEWGEPWEERSAMRLSDPEALVSRCEKYEYQAPGGVGLLTAGIDVQDDRLEVEVVGWGLHEESWSITYDVIGGDPSGHQLWEDLDLYLNQPFQGVSSELHIQAACIDTGGHHTNSVYNYCRNRDKRRVWATKGASDDRAPVWPRRPSRNNKGKVNLYIVNTSAIKERIYSRLKVRPPGPGTLHFPLGYDQHFFEMLTAETIVYDFKGGRSKKVWHLKSGKRNEALDCRALAYAALQGMFALGYKVGSDYGQIVPRESRTVTASPVTSSDNLSRREPQSTPSGGRRVVRSNYV